MGSSDRIDDQQTQPTPQPNPKPKPNPEDALQLDTLELSVKELTKSLLGRIGKKCFAKKLGQSPESAIRIDPYGKKAGIVLTFQGQTAKNLARRARASPKHPQYRLESAVLHSYVLELEEEEEMLKIEYVQGFAMVSIQPDLLIQMTVSVYLDMKGEVEAARKAK